MDDKAHNEITEHLAAYSLGILEPELLATVERHIATCEICRSELVGLDAASLALALSAPAVAAPAGARERFAQMLAADVARQSSVAVVAPRSVTEVVTPPAPAQQPAPRRAVVAPETQKRRWWDIFSPAAWTLSGAMAVMLILALGWGLLQRSELERQQSANSTAQQQIAQLQTELQQQQSQFAALQQERQLAVQVLGNPAVQVFTLLATGSDSAVARLWVDEATNNAMLVTRNLQPAPAGKVYELWFIDEQPVAIEIFNTDSTGVGVLTFQLPASLAGYNIAAITVESSRVEAPTTTPILATEL